MIGEREVDLFVKALDSAVRVPEVSGSDVGDRQQLRSRRYQLAQIRRPETGFSMMTARGPSCGKGVGMRIRVVIIFALTAACVAAARGQDPAVVNAKTIKVLFENDRVPELCSKPICRPALRNRCTRIRPTSFMFWKAARIATTRQMAASPRES